METLVNIIINKNKKVFGEILDIKKINVGFTNTIYSVNNKFIVKICTDKNNEQNFKKEIEFYKVNQINELIPKLYSSETNKKDIPFCYEIIQKIEGISLYNVWHGLNEEEREQIIKQLCDAMKFFHKNIGISYNWINKISKEFLSLYKESQILKIFNQEEQKLIDQAYSKFELYLESNEFVLVHNDLHFDNIFIDNGKIKLIDFERTMYAPKDFELDILYRMIRKPWKFASEETEEYVNLNDYKNIMTYVEKYYPEITNINNLYKRLAIYDINYFLEQLVQNPNISELKDDVLDAVKIVIS